MILVRQVAEDCLSKSEFINAGCWYPN
jgi:hypothetical protein